MVTIIFEKIESNMYKINNKDLLPIAYIGMTSFYDWEIADMIDYFIDKRVTVIIKPRVEEENANEN